MTMNKGLKDILIGKREAIKSRIREDKLDEAIHLVDSLSGAFKLPVSSYDRSNCTPYSNEVMKTYGLKQYVNASFVPTAQTLFIAAQNPKYSKREVFLDLLAKSKISLIVSLINDPKYFEEEWLQTRKAIQHMGRDLFIDESYRFGDREIRRLRYINWVDFSVITPEEMECFHSYFDKVRTDSVLIHCIAGVGRTGTFIMYDILSKIEHLTLDLFVDVFISLRSRRAHLVTNKVQLEFLKTIFLKS